MARKTFPAFPAHAQPTSLRIKRETHVLINRRPARPGWNTRAWLQHFAVDRCQWFICYTLETIIRTTIVVSRTRIELNAPLMLCVSNLSILLNIAHSVGFRCKVQYFFHLHDVCYCAKSERAIPKGSLNFSRKFMAFTKAIRFMKLLLIGTNNLSTFQLKTLHFWYQNWQAYSHFYKKAVYHSPTQTRKNQIKGLQSHTEQMLNDNKITISVYHMNNYTIWNIHCQNSQSFMLIRRICGRHLRL